MRNLIIYARADGEKRFKPMDMKCGRQVTNLIYATVYFNCDETKEKNLLDWCVEMTNDNPGWSFELREQKVKES